MIALYVEGISTTMNLIVTIFEYDSFSNVVCRFIVPREKIESLVNPVNKEIIKVKSLVMSLRF